MKVAEFDFDLPPERIAQYARPRGESRLMVLDRRSARLVHGVIRDLPAWLRRGDLLVANDTRVFPARLLGRRVPTGGAVECLLLAQRPSGPGASPAPGVHPSPSGLAASPSSLQCPTSEIWLALMHPGQKLKPGARVLFERGETRIEGEVLERHFSGRRTIRLSVDRGTVGEGIDAIGRVPLPPYVQREDTAEDRARYQTVFASRRGSIAAPTAGLHFDDPLLQALDAAGVERVVVTLHVGYGTFKPVRVEHVEAHVVDPEPYEISADAASRINAAIQEGRRIIAVGTTTTRALEHSALLADAEGEGAGEPGTVRAGPAVADQFIRPGHRFRVISGLLTNFHLPRSSLLMLVAAFAGRDRVLDAYREAIRAEYGFYSYGDAMVIL